MTVVGYHHDSASFPVTYRAVSAKKENKEFDSSNKEIHSSHELGLSPVSVTQNLAGARENNFQCLISLYRNHICQAMASGDYRDDIQGQSHSTDSVKFDTFTGELVFTGGLQQFLIKEARKKKDQQLLEQPRLCDGSSPVLTFHDLPVSN